MVFTTISYFTAERRPAIGRLSWYRLELFSVGFSFWFGVYRMVFKFSLDFF